MIVTGKDINTSKSISNFLDHKIQIQSVGVDLRIKYVYKWTSAGILDFDNTKRRIPKFKKVVWKNDTIFLKKGSYFVEFQEYINVSLFNTAVLFPRSSLMRCGVILDSSLFDPGYTGPISCIINVLNNYGISFKKDARIAQCIFIKNDKKIKIGYTGQYQNKALF